MEVHTLIIGLVVLHHASLAITRPAQVVDVIVE